MYARRDLRGVALRLGMPRVCKAGSVTIGQGQPLAIVAGPCVLESLEASLATASLVRDACLGAGLGFIFKGSFDKANRSSIRSARGPGLDRGLDWLARIRETLRVPVTTDIHTPEQAEPVARVVDLLQVPAFLCRQTDLLVACARAAAAHGRGVNVKKGQFVAPAEMRGAVVKLAEGGCENVMLTERGTFFGYHRLVNDFIGLGDLMELDAPGGSPPVCFDCTHSVQLPGAGEQTGGRPERSAMLARAAVAAGVHAVFVECHPEPEKSPSDASTIMALAEVSALVKTLARVSLAFDSR